MGSRPADKELIFGALEKHGGKVSAASIPELMVGLGLSDEMSRTQFRKAIGSLATDGALG